MTPDGAGTLETRMDAAERIALEAALARTEGRIGTAATALGITRRTLHLKMRKHGLGRAGLVEE